jgi:hypothetical protein
LLGGNPGQNRMHVDLGGRHRFLGEHLAAQPCEVPGHDGRKLLRVRATVVDRHQCRRLQDVARVRRVIATLIAVAVAARMKPA